MLLNKLYYSFHSTYRTHTADNFESTLLWHSIQIFSTQPVLAMSNWFRVFLMGYRMAERKERSIDGETERIQEPLYCCHTQPPLTFNAWETNIFHFLIYMLVQDHMKEARKTQRGAE